jgi:hypothetical protein
MGRPIINILGKRFGSFIVLHRVKDHYNGKKKKHSEVWYRVLCDCGRKISTRGYMLRHGRVKACNLCKPKGFRHGFYGTKEYVIWLTTKSRATAENIKFNLDVSDIHIPRLCPLLGIPLKLNNKKTNWNSPSIDRFDPRFGYVKNNIWVISHKANTIKSNATLQDLKLIVKNMERANALFIH